MAEPLIQGGYVIIARQVRKSKLWLSLKLSHRIVLIEILLQAQWQDGEVVRNGEILHLKRGQVATSYQHLVDDISEKSITVKIVRTAIDKMVHAQFLAKDEAVQKAKKGLLLTVVKYDVYQNPDNYKGRAEDNDKGREKAEQGQSEGRARAINKKLKNLNNINNLNTLVDSDECDNTFNTFWNAYPKRNGKAKAVVKWRSYFKTGLIDIDKIMDGLDRYKKYVDHERTVRKFDRQYLDGLTFVNGERWNDEWIIEVIGPVQSSQSEKVEKEVEPYFRPSS